MKKIIALLVVGAALFGAACTSNPAADVASKNLSTAADNFEIPRRIVFYNGITGQYVLVIEGLCSLGNNDPARELSVTCKVGPDKYIKDFLGLSDNVTYFVQQTSASTVDTYHYRVIFRPETIVPNIDLDTSSDQNATAVPSPSVEEPGK